MVCWVARINWPSTSCPALVVPKGWSQLGGWLGRISRCTVWSQAHRSGPANANSTVRTNTARLVMAMRWRTNRASTRRSCPCAAVSGASVGGSADGGVAALVGACRSLMADPRVEHAVEQVGDEVGEDDGGPAQHQPAHQGV